jgi:NAD(P)-dependent dehydrogenase (short-subunit alcohol dehydrogenase family)
VTQPLAGRIAVVTGASRGLGGAAALALAGSVPCDFNIWTNRNASSR